MKTIADIIPSAAFGLGDAPNTIGLPEIVNYNKNDYHMCHQTWDKLG